MYESTEAGDDGGKKSRKENLSYVFVKGLYIYCIVAYIRIQCGSTLEFNPT